MSDEQPLYAQICGWIGTIIGYGLNASGGVQFLQIMKGDKSIMDVPILYICSNLVCNLMNLAFGQEKREQRGDNIMVTSSGVGSGLACMWAITFTYFRLEARAKKEHKEMKSFLPLFCLYVFMILNVAVEIFWIFGKSFPVGVGEQICGYITLVFTVFNAASTGQNVIPVLKEPGYFKRIPVIICCFGFLCSGFWGFYGWVGFDTPDYVFMVAPNFLGMLINLSQIIIYFIQKKKCGGVAKEDNNEPKTIEEEVDNKNLIKDENEN